MSETITDDLEHTGSQPVNGHDVSDEDLRALLETERKQRVAVERELQEERRGRGTAETNARSAVTARYDAEAAAVTARLDAAETSAAALEREYADAAAEGKWAEAAAVQRKMAKLEAKVSQDEGYKTFLEQEREKAVAQSQQAPQQQGVDLAQFSAKQRRWIRDNPEYMEDERFRRKVAAQHAAAMADDVEVDSEEYFEYINRAAVAPRAKTKPAEDQETTVETPRQRITPKDIPVTRSGSPSTQSRNAPVKLSPEQREAADMSMPDVPEQGHRDSNSNWVPGRYERYASNIQKLKQQGKL